MFEMFENNVIQNNSIHKNSKVIEWCKNYIIKIALLKDKFILGHGTLYIL